MHRYRSLLLLTLAGFCIRAVAADAIDVDELKTAYATNNQNDVPIVSWMMWGMPQFVLYADGEIIVPKPGFKSRLGKSRLSAEALRAVLAKIESQESFWALSPDYSLTRASDQPLNIVSIRLPQREAIKVSVYGSLTARSNEGTLAPATLAPAAFLSCIEMLKSLIPEDTIPWDPGYVEIGWSDYSYAPDSSLPWPAEWPGLEGPLARPAQDMVIKWFVLFPSSRVEELDAFLGRRLERGAILVDGKKVSGHYRWPLRGEKRWTSWNQ